MSENSNAKKQPTFLTDVMELRRRAREHVEKGSIAAEYPGDLETSIRLLNEALATELVCVLRYKSHYYLADGIHAAPVAEEFLEHATQEQQHADMLARRIQELNGVPNFDPAGILTRSHAEFKNGETLVELIQEDLIAELIAIDSYREMIRFFGDKDPTSRRLIESVLAQEEEHASDLSDLLKTLDPTQASDHEHSKLKPAV